MCSSDLCDESLRGFPRRRDDTSPVCVPLAPVPRQGARDYAFWYWPGNHRPNETWPTVSRVMHFLTGFYGMSFDEERGDLVTLGRMATAPSAEDALRRPVADVDRLPGATVLFEAGSGDVRTRADRFLGGNDNVVGRARLIDGGRSANRVDIPTVRASSDPAYAGQIGRAHV